MSQLMRGIQVEKVTLNIGSGKEGSEIEKGIKLLQNLTGRKPIKTVTTKRIPTWGVRPGLPLGTKVTLRREKAIEILKRMVEAKGGSLKSSNFGQRGEVAFGVHEYIDVPDLKYDPDIGIIGFDVCITLERPGFRIKRRRTLSKKIGQRHGITKDEAIAFMKESFGVEVEAS